MALVKCLCGVAHTEGGKQWQRHIIDGDLPARVKRRLDHEAEMSKPHRYEVRAMSRGAVLVDVNAEHPFDYPAGGLGGMASDRNDIRAMVWLLWDIRQALESRD